MPASSLPEPKRKEKEDSQRAGLAVLFPDGKIPYRPRQATLQGRVHANISAELADLLLYLFGHANRLSVSVFDDGSVVPENQIWMWWNLARTVSCLGPAAR
jgi:hypothetical protein